MSIEEHRNKLQEVENRTKDEVSKLKGEHAEILEKLSSSLSELK